ncbi:MerR family transcriptional regulator [Virgibacillus sp. 179-BFC.A HS]|uniref:MerR family transcriptional regulator n=1 Tax=Tigheibacillus jepli TaxID=3035914 RepID=A0ABU5CFA0_9BACI|nr:MerR family transcriptional regulator [Virgibacillus sp. 179-BFC.A HS]MDY0404519.1 MerR family transcriptional regulator [Virgibacillus sp. 179-BFC.A HS]
MHAIGKLAEICQTTVRTIRYYDEIGLLKPTKIGSGGRRYYDQENIVKLTTILTLKELGFSLEAIKLMLEEEGNSPRELLQMRLKMIQAEREKLKKLEQAIHGTLQLMDLEDAGKWEEVAQIYQKLHDWGKDGTDLVRKTYFTEDELDALHQLPKIGQEGKDIEEIVTLVKDIRDNLHIDPASPKAEELAIRWVNYTDRIYKGNWQLANKAWQLSQYNRKEIGIYHYPEDVVAFITEAIRILEKKEGGTMNKKLVILDLLCYAAIPYLIWTYGKESLGDYYAMLLSTVPGFIYTIYRFFSEREFNIAGLFILFSLLVGTTVDLLSGSADSMLWNQVWLSYGYVLVHVLSVLFKKPLALYFAVDWSYLQGHPRKQSKDLFSRPGLFAAFQWLTCWIAFCLVLKNTFKLHLILQYGVAGYDKVIIYMKIAGWVIGILNIAACILVSVKINNYLTASNRAETKMEG